MRPLFGSCRPAIISQSAWSGLWIAPPNAPHLLEDVQRHRTALVHRGVEQLVGRCAGVADLDRHPLDRGIHARALRHRPRAHDPADLQARADWDLYGAAYEGIFRRTSTPQAPWYVVPADRKWFRNYLVANIVVETLEQMNLEYPPPPEGLDHLTIE